MEREPSRRRFLTGCCVAGAGALAAGGLVGGAAAQGAARADPPETRWDRTYEQGTSAEANAVVPANDDDGFVAVGTAEPGDSDVERELWLYKISAAGQLEWERTFSAEAVTAGFDIVAASDGYMIAGHTRAQNADAQDAIALRVADDGSETWRRTFNANPNTTDTMRAVDVDDQGRFVFAGWTSRFKDAWVARLSGPESIDWAHTYGPGEHNKYHGIVVAEDGGYVVVGETDDNDDDTTGWAVKLVEDGTQQFSQQFKKRSDSGTNPYDDFNVFYDVTQTRNGFVAVGANAFDPKTNDQNGWALEFNVNGGKLWDKRYSEDNYTVLRSVTDGTLEYFVVGETATTGDGQDARGFVANLGIEGQISWKGTWGAGSSGFSSLEMTAEEGMICLGRQGDSAGGATDGWGVKIGGEPVPTAEPTPTPTPTPSAGESTPTFTPTPTDSEGGTAAAGDGTDESDGTGGSAVTDAPTATPTVTPGDGGGSNQGTTAAGDGGGGISETTIGIGAIILALGGGGLLYNRFVAGGDDEDVAGPGAGTGGVAPIDTGDGGDGGAGDGGDGKGTDGGGARTEPSDDNGEVQQAQTVVEGSGTAATGEASGAEDAGDTDGADGGTGSASETGSESGGSVASEESADAGASDEPAEDDVGDESDAESHDEDTSKSGTGAGGQR